MYPLELRKKALKRAEEEGVLTAAVEFNVSARVIYDWKKNSNRKERHPLAFRQSVVSKAQETSIVEAATEFRLSEGTVRRWRRDLGCAPKKWEYSEGWKKAMVLTTLTAGVRKTSDAYGIPQATLRRWQVEQGRTPRRKNVKS